MIETILASLIRANLAAGAAILLVLAIRKLVRPRFGARAAYALWLAPLAAGLAALPPHAVTPSLITPVMQSAAVTADDFVAAAGPAASGLDLASLAVAVWALGLAAAVLLVAWRQGRFVRAMGRLEPGDEPGVFRAEHAGVGPAVVGTLRARIVTPADFETRFGPDERPDPGPRAGASGRRRRGRQCAGLRGAVPVLVQPSGPPGRAAGADRPGAGLRRRGDRPAPRGPAGLRRAPA